MAFSSPLRNVLSRLPREAFSSSWMSVAPAMLTLKRDHKALASFRRSQRYFGTLGFSRIDLSVVPSTDGVVNAALPRVWISMRRAWFPASRMN